jgi:hypothetical protein
VIDASNRDKPVELTRWDVTNEGLGKFIGHDMDLSPDGRRAYVNLLIPGPSGQAAFAILDTSEVVDWKPGMPKPTIKRISEVLVYADRPNGAGMSGAGHTSQFFSVGGKKYVAVSNEGGNCPAPYIHIVDVTAEKRPLVISTIMLEVHRPENCAKTLPDHNGFILGDSGGVDGLLAQYRYGAHYSGVDDPSNTKLLAYTFYSAGLHLFDVQDPYNPKHVGEFNPPALNTATYGLGRGLPDRSYSFVRFHKGNIWFTSGNGGFWIVTQKPQDYDPQHRAGAIWH